MTKTCNANRSEMNAKSNAERQRAYRDRKRGGPPRGRWAGYTPVRVFAEAMQISRTTVFMCQWIKQHTPDLEEQLHADKLKVSTVYRELKAEFDGAMWRAFEQAKRDGIDTEKNQLTWRRENGKFVFEWRAENENG